MEEIDDTLEVQFWTENVEEHVLTVALVKFCYDILHLVLHWESARCIGKAWYHLSY